MLQGVENEVSKLFKSIKKVLPGSLKDVLRMFNESFKGCSLAFQDHGQGSFKSKRLKLIMQSFCGAFYTPSPLNHAMFL